MTTEGEPFLQYEGEDGMLIFACEADLLFLASQLHWFVDGTFSITPNGYAQQYTIHAMYDGKIYPCVYALLPGKSTDVYIKFIQEVLLLLPAGTVANPASIMMDFEKAAMNAFEHHFPHAEIAGCYFHLCQSIWRKIQNMKLDIRYKAEPAFAIRVRKFLALAFVPPNEVHYYMRILMADEVSKNDSLVQFAIYFQDTYVGQSFGMGIETHATFPYRTWNMYERVKANLPRTNNAMEGWHHAFCNGLRHPTLPKLAQKYKKEQHRHLLERTRHMAGITTPAIIRKYQKLSKSLKAVISKLDRLITADLPYLEIVARLMIINYPE